VAQPLLVGRRLDINPLVVFLALWFGGLFLGDSRNSPGDSRSLVTLKVLAENSERGKTPARVPEPERDDQLTLIAHDDGYARSAVATGTRTARNAGSESAR